MIAGFYQQASSCHTLLSLAIAIESTCQPGGLLLFHECVKHVNPRYVRESLIFFLTPRRAPSLLSPGQPDSRYIRVETCMFMVKLPQYTSLDVMLEKLRYAIHYREDPLSG